MTNELRRSFPIPAPVAPDLTSLRLRDPLFGQVENLFNKFFDEFWAYGKNANRQNVGYPRLDAYQTSTHYVIQAALPGIDPEDLKVEVETGNEYKSPPKVETNGEWVSVNRDIGPTTTLHISGKMKEEVANMQGSTFYIKELSRKAFRRSVTIPEGLRNIREPECVFRNGLLTVRWELPLPNEVKSETRTAVPIRTA